MTNLNSILKSRDITFPKKGPCSQSYGFSSSHVRMLELNYKEGWAPKNWCFELWCWRRLLRVSWTARRSNQSILKEIIPEYSLEGLMLKLKLQYFGHLIVKRWLIGKDPETGKDWRREEKGMTEDEMVRWYHWLNGLEFEQALGVGDAQGSLVCCSSWDHRVGCDWVTELNWFGWIIDYWLYSSNSYAQKMEIYIIQSEC